jgi:hypothetical protein
MLEAERRDMIDSSATFSKHIKASYHMHREREREREREGEREILVCEREIKQYHAGQLVPDMDIPSWTALRICMNVGESNSTKCFIWNSQSTWTNV